MFVSGVDERHEISYPGMEAHGHYCVPILTDDTLYGVITLYVEAGHPRKPEEDRFLAAVADTLAGTIRHHRTEAALRISEERFQLAVRGTDAGIFDWDLRTNEVHFSARWKSILGFAEEELPDSFETWESRLHPEDRERALATVRAYLAGETGSTSWNIGCGTRTSPIVGSWPAARQCSIRTESPTGWWAPTWTSPNDGEPTPRCRSRRPSCWRPG